MSTHPARQRQRRLGTSQVISGPAGIGALTPTSVSDVIVDTETGTVFVGPAPMKGKGDADQNQQILTCQAVQHGIVADFDRQH